MAAAYAPSVDLVSPVIRSQLSAVASAVKVNLLEVSKDVRRDVVENIPQLRGDEAVDKLLTASVEANVTTLLHVLEHDLDPETLEVPAAAVEYARRLAQRQVPVDALVRAYRVGHGRFLTWCLEEVGEQVRDASAVVPVVNQLLDRSFRYIDHISQRVITAYQQERDHWLLSQSAARASRVKGLLNDPRVDVDLAEASVGYRLRQYHLGLVSWVTEGAEHGRGLAQLDRLTTLLAETLGCGTKPLFVPCDEAAAWSWLPMGNQVEVAWEQFAGVVADHGPFARVAAGQPAPGVDGFRQTHRQALRVQAVADLAQPGSQVTTFAETAPVALILADLDATRGWVWQVLGTLANDDDHATRLRETLRVFLSTGSRYASTAELLVLHKNTVKYRIGKAEEAVGHPLDGHRSDVEIALRICHELGGPVLRQTGTAPRL